MTANGPATPPLDIERPFLAGSEGIEPIRALVLRNGRVASHAIGPGSATRFDAEGLIAAPGFIDLQTNGGFGHDLAAVPESIWPLASQLPQTGVTAFCPTFISGPPQTVVAAQAALRARPDDHRGAHAVGLHLEGPILASEWAGAHLVEHLQPADSTLATEWTADNGVAIVTLAPELPGALGLIASLHEAGVTVAAGHTGATYLQAAEAQQAGLGLVTHLFNAMAPLHHREPGLVGRVLTAGTLPAGVIADGVHLDPSVVRLAWDVLGPNRFILVTDAVAPAGLEPGTYSLGGQSVVADRTSVRTNDGTLAGSTLTMDEAVRNLIRWAEADVVDALGSASTLPAEILGLEDRGHLRPGAVADVVLLNAELRVEATVCAGQLAYVAPSARSRVTAPAPSLS